MGQYIASAGIFLEGTNVWLSQKRYGYFRSIYVGGVRGYPENVMCTHPAVSAGM